MRTKEQGEINNKNAAAAAHPAVMDKIAQSNGAVRVPRVQQHGPSAQPQSSLQGIGDGRSKMECQGDIDDRRRRLPLPRGKGPDKTACANEVLHNNKH